MTVAELDHRSRVVEERNELAEKCEGLSAFIDGAHSTSVFAELPADEQLLLKAQYGSMERYLQVLDERILAFDKVVGDCK